MRNRLSLPLGPRRMIGAWLLVTVGVLALARVVVALPEQCSAPTAAQVDAAVVDAIGWFDRNQNDDGTWLYRYDGPAGIDLGDYHWVRHAGVLVSMEQAAAAGYPNAADVADRGWPVLFDKVVELDDGLAIEALGISTGGTSLAGIALGERRLRTGDTVHDDLLRGLGAFVAAQVQADGRVLNDVDIRTRQVIPESYSPFATGQAMFFLARLDRLFPGEGWGEPARRIGAYASTVRAENEGYVPDVSDHWGAYALAELTLTSGVTLTADERSFARKQMGIMGIQTRYESQRTNGGIDRWLRGRQTLGAGLGTIGEAIGAFWVVAEREPGFEGQRGWLAERLACTADLLAQRQVDADEAATHPDPSRSQGAWFQFGITQMDDTRHAMSALVAARTTGAVPGEAVISANDAEPPILPRRTPVPASAALVILAALAALSPTRLSLLGRGCTMIRPTIAGVAVLAGITALGGPALRALSIGTPTGVAAAGLVLAASGLWAVARGLPPMPALGDPRATEVRVLMGGVLRPETILASLAIGAGGQGWVWVLALAVVALAAGLAPLRLSPSLDAMLGWGVRFAGALAVLAGVALLVDGIYAV